ncbi:integrase [Streptomyces sp. NPDC046237]|uniref:integrase n=1 Tax=Streptomyces sp. NPDC046237 TaxID=3154914 RepID=UPI003411E491
MAARGPRVLRHFCASVLPDTGEHIKALCGFVGHADPGFTLRVYTHLVPSSEIRTPKAVGDMDRRAAGRADGPVAAQAA